MWCQLNKFRRREVIYRVECMGWVLDWSRLVHVSWGGFKVKWSLGAIEILYVWSWISETLRTNSHSVPQNFWSWGICFKLSCNTNWTIRLHSSKSLIFIFDTGQPIIREKWINKQTKQKKQNKTSTRRLRFSKF